MLDTLINYIVEFIRCSPKEVIYMYSIKYNGNGRIEIHLPSYPEGLKLNHGEVVNRHLTDADKRAILSCRDLGLTCSEIKKEVKVENTIKPESVEVTTVEEKALTKEDLMKKTSIELKKMLTDLGEEDPVGSKSELADRILEKVNGANNI